MSSFVSHLLSRHIETGNHVKPRLRARFEPVKTFSNPHIADEGDAPDVTMEPGQIDSFQEQDELNATTAAVQTPATQQDLAPLSSFTEGTKSVHNESSQPFLFRHALQQNDPAVLPGKMSHIPDGIAPSRIQDQPFSKPHIENNAVQQVTGTYFDSNNAAPTISNPHAAENGTQVTHNLTTNRPSESRNDALREARHLFQKLRNGKDADHQVAETGPFIKVTIGRIDVQAVVQSAPAPVKQAPAATPKLSLDDYLKQRNQPST